MRLVHKQGIYAKLFKRDIALILAQRIELFESRLELLFLLLHLLYRRVIALPVANGHLNTGFEFGELLVCKLILGIGRNGNRGEVLL